MDGIDKTVEGIFACAALYFQSICWYSQREFYQEQGCSDVLLNSLVSFKVEYVMVSPVYHMYHRCRQISKLGMMAKFHFVFSYVTCMDNMDNMDVKIRVRLGEQHRCEGIFLHNECPGTSEQQE